MKLSVSLGQILLDACGRSRPIWSSPTRYTTQRRPTPSARSSSSLARAVTSVDVVRRRWTYVGWSTSFALPASSLCFAECFQTRSPAKKAWLLLMTFAPAIYGSSLGKAFYYGYVVGLLGDHRVAASAPLVLVAAPLVLAVYVVAVLPFIKLLDTIVPSTIWLKPKSSNRASVERRPVATDSRTGLASGRVHRVLGVGPGNNYPYMLRYSTLGTAHNQYVNILIELGAVGLACFAVFSVQALRVGLALHAVPRTGRTAHWCSAGSACSGDSRRRILRRFHAAEHSKRWSGTVRGILRAMDCPGSHRQRCPIERGDIEGRAHEYA